VNPWTDPASYEPEHENWWERNRVRATALAAIFLMLVLALASPWIHR
jgi:hypothetical protein